MIAPTEVPLPPFSPILYSLVGKHQPRSTSGFFLAKQLLDLILLTHQGPPGNYPCTPRTLFLHRSHTGAYTDGLQSLV